MTNLPPGSGSTSGAVLPALEVRGLCKTYTGRGDGGRSHSFPVVDAVSFSLAVGGALAVVGESGSGKTTIARMIVGQETPTAGRILLHGEDWTTAGRRSQVRRRRGEFLQIVFQDPYTSLDPRQRVGSCLDEALRLHTALDAPGRRERAAELLSSVGLDTRLLGTLPRELSGGQRQRVAIARALAPSPSVLILDEAVSALDVSVQAQVLNLLSDIRERTKVAYLFISHDLAVVRQVADYILVLKGGQAVEYGSADQVLNEPRHPYTQLLRASAPRPGWRPINRAHATTEPGRLT